MNILLKRDKKYEKVKRKSKKTTRKCSLSVFSNIFEISGPDVFSSEVDGYIYIKM